MNSDLDLLDSIFTTATTRPIASQILSSTRFLDATTTSKSVLLVLSGITTTTGRNLTVQDADGVLAYTAQVAAATTGIVTGAGVAAATATLVALLAASAFTSTAVTGVTTTAGDNSTKFATTAYADRIGVQQIVTNITGALSTGTTQIPVDDTIPQNTEGDQYMSASITPRSATSKLIIDVVANASQNSGAAAYVTAALFQDSTASALAASLQASETQFEMVNISFRWVMTSGTTSATTFKVRVGTSTAATTTFNGSASGRIFGGIFASSIVITEVGF